MTLQRQRAPVAKATCLQWLQGPSVRKKDLVERAGPTLSAG